MNASKVWFKGFTMGVFDCIHAGHVQLIQRCLSLCSELTVGLMEDDWVAANKGQRPLFSIQERTEAIWSLFPSAYVVECNSLDVTPFLQDFRADVFFHGSDWLTSSAGFEAMLPLASRQFMKDNGITCVLLPYFDKISTSEIRKRAQSNESK